MRSFFSLFVFELRLFLRNVVNLLFVLLFPSGMLLLFGSIYGNEPSALFGGNGTIDVSVPSYICMIVAVTGLMSLPITLCTYRQNKVLKRLQATPLRSGAILGVHFAVNLFMTLIGVALLLALAFLMYDIAFTGVWWAVLLVALLVIISIFSIGVLIASVFRSAKTAIAVANIVYFPMLFLSGASVPIELMPDGVRKVAQALPLTHAVTAMKAVWLNKPLDDWLLSVIVLGAVSIVCIITAVCSFRWE